MRGNIRKMIIKKVRKIAAGILFMLLFIGIIPLHTVLAADGSVSVAVSSSSVIVGDTVNVSVTLNYGAGVSTAQFNVNYDASKLSYVSGDADGSSFSGVIPITFMPSDYPTSYTWNFSFKANQTGSCTISTSAVVFIDPDVNPFSPSMGSASVSIGAVGSDDATLNSLQVGGASLSPAFAKWTTNYTCYVGSDVTAVTIGAAASQGGRTEVGGNPGSLNYGGNNITVTSYAPNGKTMTYTINVVRSEPATEPTSTEAPETTAEPETMYGVNVKIDNASYTIDSNYAADILPEGFASNLTTYNGKDVLAATNSKYKVTLLYLLDKDNKGAFYTYNSKDNSFYKYVMITGDGHSYILADPEKAASKPDGCTQKKIKVKGTEIDAYVGEDNDEFAYFYAVNDKAETVWYCYDTVEETVQRMNLGATQSISEDLNTQITDLQNDKDKAEQDKQTETRMKKIFMIASIVLLVMCIVLFIITMIVNNNRKKTVTADDLDDDLDEDDVIAAEAQAAATDESDEQEDADESQNEQETAKESPEESEVTDEAAQETVAEEDTAITEQNADSDSLTGEEAESSEPEVTSQEAAQFDAEADNITSMLAAEVADSLSEGDNIEAEIISLDDDDEEAEPDKSDIESQDETQETVEDTADDEEAIEVIDTDKLDTDEDTFL